MPIGLVKALVAAVYVSYQPSTVAPDEPTTVAFLLVRSNTPVLPPAVVGQVLIVVFVPAGGEFNVRSAPSEPGRQAELGLVVVSVTLTVVVVVLRMLTVAVAVPSALYTWLESVPPPDTLQSGVPLA